MPDIRVTGLTPVRPKYHPSTAELNALADALQRVAAADVFLRLSPESFKVFFVATADVSTPTLLVEVVGLFDRSLGGEPRTREMRDALLMRLDGVLRPFVASRVPRIGQIHYFCPELRTDADGFLLSTVT